MSHPYLQNTKRALALNLKALRSELGLAQERLGFDAEVDRTLVSKIEREIANPTLDVLVKIALRLNVPLQRLFEGAETSDSSLGGGGYRRTP